MYSAATLETCCRCQLEDDSVNSRDWRNRGCMTKPSGHSFIHSPNTVIYFLRDGFSFEGPPNLEDRPNKGKESCPWTFTKYHACRSRAVDGDEWLASRPTHFTPEEITPVHNG